MTKETMRALRYHGHPKLHFEELPLPDPGEKWVRIRPISVGIDGTDAHVLKGEFPALIPIVPGHEVAGVVEKIGPGVMTLKEGDLVTVEPHEFCGTCRYCRIGKEHLCLDKKAFGFHLNGGLAEAMIVPEKVAYLLPDGIGPDVGCMTEPVACCVHAIDRLQPVPGLSLMVFGAGTAGLILIKLASLSGLSPIIAVEPQSDRREMARNFGADVVFDANEPRWRNRALQLTGEEGFDFIIDAVGSGQILEDAIQMTARGARLLVFGVATPEDIASLNPYEIFRKELSIIGTVINPYTHYRAVQLLPKLGLEHLPVHKFTLDEYEAAYEMLGRGGKVIITPQERTS
jgi:L-iditol 2-dehydrogenase